MSSERDRVLVYILVEARWKTDGGRALLVNRKKSVLVRSWAFVIVVGRDRDSGIAR
jgi:hypothetical protein